MVLDCYLVGHWVGYSDELVCLRLFMFVNPDKDLIFIQIFSGMDVLVFLKHF